MLADVTLAISRARSYLLDHAEQQFVETRHVMRFPHAAGFSGLREEQASDVFTRAVLASVLFDIAELEIDVTFKARLFDIVQREADHVARARLSDRSGGWSYFPELPELPPDADSLSAAIQLFARAAPHHAPLCDEPISLALNNVRPDASLSTWIIGAKDAPAQRAIMEHGVNHYWGNGADVDVCANFYFALMIRDRLKYETAIARGAQYVLSSQQPDGSWDSTWYFPQTYGIVLCLRLLRELSMGQLAISRSLRFLETSQRSDGGWGVWQTVPLDTSLALWIFGLAKVRELDERIKRGIKVLLDYQTDEGSWNASPWIKMPVGRAGAVVYHIATYQSAVLTTAFCLRALLLARSWLS